MHKLDRGKVLERKLLGRQIKKDETIKTYIRRADESLGELGYTEHSFAHVAKVSATGKITAVGGGTAKIYAQSPDGLVKSNEITVTVTAPSAPPTLCEEQQCPSYHRTLCGVSLSSISHGTDDRHQP